MNLHKLVRPHILKLKPYSSARSEFKGSAKIFLDANENSLGAVIPGELNRYPDPLQVAVKEKLATLKSVRPEQIFLGNGSDEPIDLLFRAFCEPKRDHVITLPPTYGMYQVSAEINQVKVIPVPLTEEFQINRSEVIASIRPGSKIIFICSPNNPSGNLMDREAILAIIRRAPGLVVVDEAYIDFAPEASLLPLLEEYPNLVVLQTFSKAWGLAGLRLGMAYANPEVVDILNRIKPPYNINRLTQEKALEALDAYQEQQVMVANIIEGRNSLAEKLMELPLVESVFPSQANFLLVKMDHADLRYQQMLEQEVVLRNRSRLTWCDNCLRITVGTPGENEQLLKELAELPDEGH